MKRAMRLDPRRLFRLESRRLLRLYPRDWRARYGDEFAALIERCPPSPGVLFDILRGALDAHLHEVWRHNMPDARRDEVLAFSKRFSQMIDEGTSLVRCLLTL